MNSFTAFCEKNFGALMIGGLILAYFVPQIFLPIQNFADVLLMVTLFCGFLKIKLSDIKAIGANKRALAINLPIYLLVFPVVTYLVCKPFVSTEILAGMVLLFGISAGVTCGFVASLLKLNIAWSTAVTVFTSLLVPFTLPALSQILLGTSIEISATEMSLDMIKLIFIPGILAFLVNKSPVAQTVRRFSGTVGIFSVVLFAPALVARFHAEIVEQLFTMQSLWSLLLMTVFFIIRFIIGYYLALKPQDKKLSLSNALNYGFMNNGITILLAAKFFGPVTFFFLLISEIPWIIFQPIFAKFTRKHLSK